MTGYTTDWRRPAILIAIALAALAGFFFLGRALTDDGDQPPNRTPASNEPLKLPSAEQLVLAGRVPDLAQEPRDRRSPGRPAESRTPAETEPTTEAEEALVDEESTETTTPEEPRSPEPTPPAPPPAPSPPPPQPEPEPKPDKPDKPDQGTDFDDSG